MVKINWTPQSKNDLISIGEYIAQDSKKFAKIQVNRIREQVKLLANFPNLGRIVPELSNSRIREIILGNYRIIYLFATDERIDVLTVHHSAKALNL